jgi:2-polyprenylphenol hydroxylase and related flavodoxin oxidoreductases
MITTEVEVKLEKLISDTLGIFTIKPDKLVKWIPGMFLQLSLTRKTASEPWLDSKPFSIASWGGEEMKIIVRKEGKFTTSLFDMASEGFVSSIKYPLGNFYLDGRGKKIFIAGGAGISVFTSYLDFLTKEKLRRNCSCFIQQKSPGSCYHHSIGMRFLRMLNSYLTQLNQV